MVRVGEHPEHVMVDQDLAAGSRAGADADGWDLELVSDRGRELRRNTLEHNREAPRVLQPESLVVDLLCLLGGLAQGSEPAQDADRLRSQAWARRASERASKRQQRCR